MPMIRVESHYLLISNQERCKAILTTSNNLHQQRLIDVFISLHIVLEVGLNTFFRELTLAGIKKEVDELEIMKNLDKVSFIDKVIMFVYNSSFDFSSEGILEQATEHHSIIGKIRQFAGIRNKLLHGHSIASLDYTENTRHTETKLAITNEGLRAQIKLFIAIQKGLAFYLQHLNTSWTGDGKSRLVSSFLDYNFIPEDWRE
jgi:hypothetical protein